MNSTQWARLETAVNCRLRRGAWYRIIDLTVDEAWLDECDPRNASQRGGPLAVRNEGTPALPRLRCANPERRRGPATPHPGHQSRGRVASPERVVRTRRARALTPGVTPR
jgi:hypothetical protein